MGRKAAPTSLTGGRGFAFEDQVAAWLLVHMLKGGTPFGPNKGSVVRVHWQARDKGWLLDDLVVELQSSSGGSTAAMSVKSDRQVTANGFPDTFVRDIWQLCLKSPSGSFLRDRDLMTLVVGDLASGVKEAWNDLLRQALEADTDRVAARLATDGMTSEEMRALFESLHCPGDLAGGAQSDADAHVRLLRSVRLLSFDFLHTPSQDLDSVHSEARGVVADGSLTSARILWQCLCGFSETQRAAGGSADIRKVLEIVGLPQLLEHPDNRAAWRTLRQEAEIAISSVRSDIAGRLSLPRSQLFSQTTALLDQRRAAVLIGQSGSGKSVLAKRIATQALRRGGVIWLGTAIAQRVNQGSIESALNISSRLIDLIGSLAGPSALLIIDGIDRFDAAGVDAVAALIAATAANPRWQYLVTATPDGWTRLSRALTRSACELSPDSVKPIPDLHPKDLSAALSGLPRISHLALRPELHPLLRNLKILDWVADESVQQVAAGHSGPAGMPAIAEWVWQRWIKSGAARHARAQLLKLLAQTEGGHLSAGAPVGAITDHLTLAALEDDRIVAIEHEWVRFEHDLIGDWARLHLLIERRSEGITAIVDVVSLPRWQHAIQLFGQWTLEQSAGVSEWAALLGALDAEIEGATLASDLLLESLVVGTNTTDLLEKAWTELIRGDGVKLRRLLRRFHHIATFPDPRIDAIAEGEREREILRASVRLPFWPLWLPVLPVLARHVEDLLRVAPDIAADLCRTWLAKTPNADGVSQFPGRDIAAQLAMQIGREFQAKLEEGHHFHEKEDEAAWEALFLAADVAPDEVGSILLELSGRRPVSPEIDARARAAKRAQKKAAKEQQEKLTPEQRRVQRRFTSSPFPRGPKIGPWPDGPTRRIHESFRRVTLTPHAIIPLLHHRTEVATEILLAACIDGPHEGNPFGAEDPLERLEIWSWDHGTPPMYFRGPFANALAIAPEAAVDLIIRLVNFATERWEESDQQWEARHGGQKKDEAEANRRVQVMLDGTWHAWLGDVRVYGWHRDRLRSVHIVVSALMALERWFYEQLDAGKDVEETVRRVWQHGQSVAFLGLFSSLGRKQRDLLAGCLRPLLSVWQVYGWDQLVVRDTELGAVWRISMMQWANHGERIFNEVQDWHVMPHRKLDLVSCAVHKFLTDENVQKWFADVRESWSSQMNALASDDRDSLELLIARFDPKNYVAQREGDQIVVALEWPDELKAKTAAALAASERGIKSLGFPIRCRQILDGEKTLSKDDLSTFWGELQELAQDSSERDNERRPAIVCGGLAVVASIDLDWLLEKPERWKWAVEQVGAIVKSPPRSQFDVPESVGNIMWDCFFAELAVFVLARTPDDLEIREWAALGVMSFHYNATECAIVTARKLRNSLQGDFDQILTVALLWAGLRRVIEHGQSLEGDCSLYSAWGGRLIRAFVNKNLPQSLQLDRIADFGRRVIDRQYGRRFPESNRPRRRPNDLPGARRRRLKADLGIDPTILKVTVSALLPLESSDALIRRQQLDLARVVIRISLETLAAVEEDEEDLEVDGTPGRFDRWVFDYVAVIAPRMTDAEKPQELLESILRLGPSAHYSVEDFLRSWLIDGYRSAQEKERFFHLWRQMIDSAWELPSWTAASGRAAFHLDNMWIELMGMGMGGISIADDPTNAAHIEAMIPLYERWAADWLTDHDACAAFARFVQRPAARRLLLPAIKVLSTATRGIREYRWDSSEVGSVIAAACSCCWQHCRQQLEADPNSRKAFLDLLRILAERQEPEGLQLRDEVLRSVNGSRT